MLGVEPRRPGLAEYVIPLETTHVIYLQAKDVLQIVNQFSMYLNIMLHCVSGK